MSLCMACMFSPPQGGVSTIYKLIPEYMDTYNHEKQSNYMFEI